MRLTAEREAEIRNSSNKPAVWNELLAEIDALRLERDQAVAELKRWMDRGYAAIEDARAEKEKP